MQIQETYSVRKRVPVSPSRRYFVELEGKAFNDRSEGGLYIETMFNPGEYAAVTGVIRSVPLRGGIPGLRVGDQIAFDYLAVYDEDVINCDSDEVFYEDEVDGAYHQWSNKVGVTLQRIYMKNDKYEGRKLVNDVVVEVVKGDFGRIESWLETHKFRDRTGKKYRNLLDYEGEEYWGVDAGLVYAVKRGEQLETVPGCLLCRPPAKRERVGVHESGLFTVRDQQEKTAWLEVLVAPNGSEYAGKQVYLKLAGLQPYKFWGVDYLLAREEKVLLARPAELQGEIKWADPKDSYDGSKLNRLIADEYWQMGKIDFEQRRRETNFDKK